MFAGAFLFATLQWQARWTSRGELDPLSQAFPDPTAQPLRVFVYGTLKRGYCNHDRYCRGYRQVEAAFVWGRLNGLGGYCPMLVIPELPALAHGTHDPQADTNTQAHWSGQDVSQHPALRQPEGPWWRINGEVFTFDDPLTRLPHLDELEAFAPGGTGMYDRVLLPVRVAERIEPCWVYIAPGGRLPDGAEPLPGDWIE